MYRCGNRRGGSEKFCQERRPGAAEGLARHTAGTDRGRAASGRGRTKRLNVLLFEPIFADVVGGDRVGRPSILVAAISVYHLSQRRGGLDGAGLQLVGGGDRPRLAGAVVSTRP